MISRREFQHAIDSFLMELTAFPFAETEASLRALPALWSELEMRTGEIRTDGISPSELPGIAVGVVDEYVRAKWDEIVTESYALYVDTSGGRSHRHPDAPRPDDGA